MKKLIITLLLTVFSAGAYAQNLFVGTYNVRNDNQGDTEDGNGWVRRCPVIADMLNFEQPDVFGTQECRNNQIRDLVSKLPGYDFIGTGRDDGKEAGEYSAIFYNKNVLKLLNQGNFWLNETPTKPGLGWDAACIRICTWGKFREKVTGFTFYFFNLHMDHVGVVARRESAKLVVKKIKEIAGPKASFILTGDFNVDQTDEIYRIFTNSGLLSDSYEIAGQRFAENGTFQGFDSDSKTSSRIDHIFVSNDCKVNHYGILTHGYWTPNAKTVATFKNSQAPSELNFSTYQRRLPSDHYPVFAKISFPK